MKPHRGTTILVLGVLSLILCAPLGIVAWLMGNADLKEIAGGTMDPEGKQLTTIGRILGMIASILLFLGLIAAILVLALGGLGAVMSAQ